MIRLFLLTTIFLASTTAFGAAQTQVSIPEIKILELFADFGETLDTDPGSALVIADNILAEADEPELRLTFARAALKAGELVRAQSYLAPLLDRLEDEDPRLTEVYDLLSEASRQRGDAAEALEYGLLAYNSLETRLGPENPILLDRLEALEPQVRDLQPELLDVLSEMRERIENTESKNTLVRGEGDPQAITVWYGTNRKATKSKDPAQYYGTEPGKLSVGQLTVTIPPDHFAGKIERPSNWFFTEHLDPKKYVVLSQIKNLALDAFADGCCGAEDRLLFIHGYNVSFHDGALRAAQLAFDLEFPGKAMYYSWPSQSSLFGYLTDANNVISSRPAMETFFEMATRGEGKLHVIAHSMGNRYTLEALETFFLKHPDRKIGQLVLAAPDVDRAAFEARFEAISRQSEGITLYASKHDLALSVSRRVNGGYRLGDANGEIVQLAGLDTVDVSRIEADMLGHSYFGDTSQVLGDLHGLVRLGWQPGERCGVSEVDQTGSGEVWEVLPEGCPVEQVRAAGDLMRIHGKSAREEAKLRLDAAPGDELDFWLGVMAIMDRQLGN